MHSYSSIKDFKQCPALYYEKRIAKSIPFVQSPEAQRGERIHKAFEDYVGAGVPLPEELLRFEPLVYDLAQMDGVKLTEHPMAVDHAGKFVPYHDPAVANPKPWNVNKAAMLGGIADLVALNEAPVAIYIDYKTGKGKYPDLEQCELMAYMIMAEHEWINRVDTGLLFVDAGKLIERSYLRAEMPEIIERWRVQVARIETAKATNVWQRKPNNLCGWCPVTHCPDWVDRNG